MKIAYIDHSYRQKTKSTDFLIDILTKNNIDVEFIWDDAWSGGEGVQFDSLVGKYDAYIFFQQAPKSSVSFSQTGENITYIPMLDIFGSEHNLHNYDWKHLLGCKVLCFSKHLENAISKDGIATKFFQYFPNPQDFSVNSDFDKITGFFWTRCPDQISWKMIKQVLNKANVQSIHLHQSTDPFKEKDIIPQSDMKKYDITISDWFEDNNSYIEMVEKSQLYFAPRFCEGIGMSFIEAMAMGKCVIAPNVGTMNEYIISGLNGVLYDVDANEVVKLIPETLILDRDNIKSICKNARRSVEMGYKQWRAKEKELMDLITAPARDIYDSHFHNKLPEKRQSSIAIDSQLAISPEPQLMPHVRESLSLCGNEKKPLLSPEVSSPMRRITLRKLIKYALPYGIVKWYKIRKYRASTGERVKETPSEHVEPISEADTQYVSEEIFIVTPCRNVVDTIDETISSVLSQSGDFYLFYHVQDAMSDDGTIEVLRKWEALVNSGLFPVFCKGIKFSFSSEKDSGMYDAINKAFSRFEIGYNSIMSWINADDIYLPCSLQTVFSTMRQHRAVRWITGKLTVMQETVVLGADIIICHPKDIISSGLCDGEHWDFIQQEGTFWKKSLWDEVAGLDSSFRLAGDYDLWIRFAQKEDLWNYEGSLGVFRYTSGRLSESLIEYIAEMNRVYTLDERIRNWQDISRFIYNDSDQACDKVINVNRIFKNFGDSTIYAITERLTPEYSTHKRRMEYYAKNDKPAAQFDSANIAVRDLSGFSMDEALRRLSSFIGASGTIIDVGASDGHWTRMALKHYPKRKYFLIDARAEHESALQALSQEKGIRYEIAAAGDTIGQINFHVTEDLFGGVASHEQFVQGENRTVPVVTLDECIRKYHLQSPYIIKLDTHGFEIPILEGAGYALQHADALVIEVYNFNICKGSLKFPDLCRYLEGKGFMTIGLADPMNRKYDDAFWQMDLLFVRKNNKAFDYNNYQ